MVLGSRAEGGASAIPSEDRKTVMSIKEVARNHSYSEIYAVLKESNMDPDETAQKLLNQDPFREVKKKRDRKKEISGWNSNEPRKPVIVTALASNQVSSDWNSRRTYSRSTPGVSHEFRVVRDNRANQISIGDGKHEASRIIVSAVDRAQIQADEKSSSGNRVDQKSPLFDHSDGRAQSFDSTRFPVSGVGHSKVGYSTGVKHEVENIAIQKSGSEFQKELDHNPCTPTSSRSTFGVYSSSSDPVHVPSDSRTGGTVGAIKREVGVVGKRPSLLPSASSSLSSAFPVQKDISSPTASSGHTAIVSKNIFNQTSSESVSSTTSVRNFPANQHGNKQRPQSAGHSKAQSTMEWKPKSVRKPSADTGVSSQDATTGLSHTEVTSNGNVEATLSDKLSEVCILVNEHVIIPKHLRVPEAERLHVTFGSFGPAFGSEAKAMITVGSKKLEVPVTEPMRIVPSATEVSDGGVSLVEGADFGHDQPLNYISESPDSLSPSGQLTVENADQQHVESFGDMGLVQSHSHSQSSEQHDLHNSPNLPTFSEAYDIQQNYEVPFLSGSMVNNINARELGSLPEKVGSNVASSSSAASVPLSTHHPSLTQHQQVTQLYPQLQFSHFPNYLPYHRQILSPMFVPPMAMPTNYTTNPAYPHPSNGSSYLLMPGGSSHLTAAGMKFAASQFKPATASGPNAYGNYTSPAGYAISSTGNIGSAAGLEDLSRIKYKDNNLYVQNPQAETSEIWVQNPRDIAGMQSTHYYNVPGQTPHAAYLPTHGGQAAVQPSHIQFPGLYHSPQPAAMANPHHLVHQQLPPNIGGNAGVGMPAPGPQVGSYQPQLGHLNWSNNF